MVKTRWKTEEKWEEERVVSAFVCGAQRIRGEESFLLGSLLFGVKKGGNFRRRRKSSVKDSRERKEIFHIYIYIYYISYIYIFYNKTNSGRYFCTK